MRAAGDPGAAEQNLDGRLCGLALVAAPLLILAAMIVHHPHGVDGASWYESAQAGHTRFYIAHLLFLASGVAFLPAAAGLADLITEREPRLARVGRTLVLFGIAGFCVLVGMDLFLWQLVLDPSLAPASTVSAAEHVTASVGIGAPVAILVAGAPFGFGALALGLHRAHEVSDWSALAIAAGVPLTFAGLPLGWLAIAGAIVATAGMAPLGWKLAVMSEPARRSRFGLRPPTIALGLEAPTEGAD